MDIADLLIEQKFYFGKSRRKLLELVLIAKGFRIDDDGVVQYTMQLQGLYSDEQSRREASFFFVARDLMATTRGLIRRAMNDNPGYKCYFDYQGEVIEIEELAQIFLFQVPWSA